MPTITRTSPDRPWIPKRKAFGRMKVDNSKFYNSKAWRNCATAHKVANGYLCKNVDKCGNPAVITNHNPPLVELLADGKSPFSWDYLEDLCASCNASVTGKQAHKSKENG